MKLALMPVRGRLRSALIETALPFVAHTGEQPGARNEMRQLPYPVQVVRFDEGFALVALGGEVAAEYTGKIRKLLHDKEIVVAANCNDGASVVPGTGGPGAQEAERMMEFGLPGPLTAEAEERVLEAVGRAWKRAGKR